MTRRSTELVIPSLKPLLYEKFLKSANNLNIDLQYSGRKIFGFTGSLKRYDFDAPIDAYSSAGNVKRLIKWLNDSR